MKTEHRPSEPSEPLVSIYETLSEAGQELAPINYRYIVSRPARTGESIRIAESDFYHTKSFVCLDYEKPISKVLSTNEKI